MNITCKFPLCCLAKNSIPESGGWLWTCLSFLAPTRWQPAGVQHTHFCLKLFCRCCSSSLYYSAFRDQRFYTATTHITRCVSAKLTNNVELTGVLYVGAIFQDLRALLPSLAPEDLGIAGQATALLQWHQVRCLSAHFSIIGLVCNGLSDCEDHACALLSQANQYCGRCGARTSSIEAGAKRQCTSDKAHRAYPRTDPVVGLHH